MINEVGSDAIITLIITRIALWLFITEYYTVDLVALGIICALVLTGVIKPTPWSTVQVTTVSRILQGWGCPLT